MTRLQPVGGPLIECHRALATDSALFDILINGIKVDIEEHSSGFQWHKAVKAI